MKLDKLANIAVILMVVVFVASTIYDRVSPRISKRSPPARLIGKTLPLPPSVSRGSNATLVLFVSPTCHYCTESMPFYGRVARLRLRGSNAFKVLGVTPAGHISVEEGRQYLVRHGVTVDAVVQMSFPGVGITATPTLALLDSSGRIIRAWTGRLPDRIEREVIESVQGLCAECKGV